MSLITRLLLRRIQQGHHYHVLLIHIWKEDADLDGALGVIYPERFYVSNFFFVLAYLVILYALNQEAQKIMPHALYK